MAVHRSEFGSIGVVHRRGRRPVLRARFTVPAALRHQHPGWPRVVTKDFAYGAHAQAVLWLAKEETAIRKGVWTPYPPGQAGPTANVTVRGYWQGWLRDRTWAGHRLRPSTVYTNRLIIVNHILPALGDMRLADITQATVNQWVAHMPEGQPVMRRNAVKILAAMLRTASLPGPHGEPPIVKRYPLAHLPSAPRRKHRIVPATPGQVRAIAGAMPPRYQMAVWLAVMGGGLRIGEVCALQRGDFDAGLATLTISRTREPLGPAKVGPTKTAGSTRTVDIPASFQPALKGFLKQYVRTDLGSWLFPSLKDPAVPIAPQSLRTMFAKARSVAGRPDLHFHDLRHTALTWLAGEGATVKELMDTAGHSTPRIAMIYQHEAHSRKRELADRLGEMALPGSDRERLAKVEAQIKRLEEERDMLVQRIENKD